MTMKLITVCERHEIEEIIDKEIKRAYDLYPLGFEATVEIKSEVAGVYDLPHYVDLKVKVCPTKHVPDVVESVAHGVSTQAYSFAKLFAGENPHCG